MHIDLHLHSKDGSDGRWPLEQIFAEAAARSIDLISVTDHDSIRAQAKARELAAAHGIRYLTGVELNVTFSHAPYRNGKAITLDFLGYGFDLGNQALADKLHALAAYRQERAGKILDKLNQVLVPAGFGALTATDMAAIQATADGSIGRPHIANYLIEKGIVANKQEAFDQYLVQCNVPKMPLGLDEASTLMHGAGGKLVLAHANDPNGTSLASLTRSLAEQQEIIRQAMLPWIDGIECWHSRHDPETASSYYDFARSNHLLVSGGSDCHQQPVLLGTVDVPALVAEQKQLLSA